MPVVLTIQALLVSVPKPESARETSLAIITSQPLRVNLRSAYSTTLSVSAANPITHRSPFWRESSAKISTVSTSSMRSKRSLDFLSLWSAGVAGV